MAIAGIPEVINDFNLYLSGNKLGGTTGEVALPDFEPITSTTSGNGILGEYEAIVLGHFGSMEQEIPFRCINEDYFKMVSPSKSVELTLRGAIQQSERDTLNEGEVGMRVVFRGRCKKISIGTVKQREQMGSMVSLELTYILIEMDGKERICLDKINTIYRINGVDQLAKIRALT
ncbi:phage tail protein [Clostridiaceae bacterium]|nr:phage tail protein [Clostridiaceae bacterium]NBI81252.1 phage tail protein [Clostridiaceae bacterium]